MLYMLKNKLPVSDTLFQLLRFALSGGLSTLLYGVFSTAFALFTSYSILVSHTASFFLCIPISYLLQRNFTFRHQGRHSESLPKYFITLILTYFISSIVVWLLVDVFEMSHHIATMSAMITVPMISYLSLYLWVFI
ncbi:MAG: GtrA family protein [Thiotrichaceae bacterium]|nr:GtrA family protein [Thiotrichaceae bacterium]